MRIFFSLFAAQTGHYYRVGVNEACPPCLHGDQLMIIRHKGCSDNAQTGKKYIQKAKKKTPYRALFDFSTIWLGLVGKP